MFFVFMVICYLYHIHKGSVMRSENLLPNQLLSPYISKYNFTDLTISLPIEKCIPDGSVKLFIYESENHLQYFTANGKKLNWKNGVGGHPLSNDCYMKLDKPGIKVVICYFKATGFYRFFKIPIHLLNNDVIPAEEIFGREYRIILSMLQNATTNYEKKNILDRFFSSLFLKKQPPKTTLISLAEDCILNNTGNIKIERITSMLNISPRTLERYFIERVGMSPKQFCKVIRFNQAVLLRKLHPDFSWVEIIFRCGYYDQSHYIGEFKSFTGLSPNRFYSKDFTISELYTGNYLNQ